MTEWLSENTDEFSNLPLLYHSNLIFFPSIYYRLQTTFCRLFAYKATRQLLTSEMLRFEQLERLAVKFKVGISKVQTLVPFQVPLTATVSKYL